MYLVVGLGNPENEGYGKTRHNMGFNTINDLAKKLEIELNQTKFKSLYTTTTFKGEKLILVKPQTYMNASGEAVVKFKNFYKIPNENLIVIYDDIDIEKGEIRIRKKGSAGSHNGMKSVIECLNTEEFIRIRIGIGKPKDKEDLIDYVIAKMPKEDEEILKEGVEKAKEAVIKIVTQGIDKAMNDMNIKGE